jgi:DNA-binding NarL/FixJ family response regulator
VGKSANKIAKLDMGERKHRIFIAEHETLIRDGLKALLASHSEFEVVGEASDGMAVLRGVEKIRPDLILSELNLPKMSGIAVLRNIRKQSQDIKIIVLTIQNNVDYVKEVFNLGGSGYCLKEDITREELFVAIRNVINGKPYVSPSILHNVLNIYLNSEKKLAVSPLKKLSSREQDVLKLIGEGYSIKEIGEYLYISKRTAETHRYNIMKKLNLHRTAALVGFAIENGLVTR